MLVEKQVAWSFTGRLRTLRKAAVATEMGENAAQTLYPDRYDHDATILGHGTNATSEQSATSQGHRPDPALTQWLSRFEAPTGIGSNSWVVSGEHTDTGAPLLANDPHVPLMAPPIWYEMHLSGPKTRVRGVTLPGIPFGIIGETDRGAWGVTVAYTDGIDFYTYETRDGAYRYGDSFQEFDAETRTIEVAGGEDRDVTVKKSVHGPVLGIESDGDELDSEVAIAWTGLTATRTGEAVLELCRSNGLSDVQEALRKFDLPSLNIVYADRDGNTLYRVVGRVPIRRTNGDPVPGNKVFNGSAKEGEWPGFVPYGASNWEEKNGVIPYEEMPHTVNPDYIGTANQRVVDDADYPHYISESYATPFRGIRLWERLDDRIESDTPVDPAFMRSLQRDTHDERAAMMVPTMLKASNAAEGPAAALLAELDSWDYRMDRDSRAALIFSRFIPHYREVVFKERLKTELDDRRDPEEYYGNDWVLITLDPNSAWFPDGRDTAIVEALKRTATELDENGWETYGDYNTTALDHRFDREWLNYPRYPTDGAEGSLNNFRKESEMGSSWRQICPMDGSTTAQGAFPGGNSGLPMSNHYDDQLKQWADGKYKPIPLSSPDSVTVRFTEGDG